LRTGQLRQQKLGGLGLSIFFFDRTAGVVIAAKKDSPISGKKARKIRCNMQQFVLNLLQI
jgi:hypothetical protein